MCYIQFINSINLGLTEKKISIQDTPLRACPMCNEKYSFRWRSQVAFICKNKVSNALCKGMDRKLNPENHLCSSRCPSISQSQPTEPLPPKWEWIHVHTEIICDTRIRSLSILRTKTKTLGPRGFYSASYAAWNALPFVICTISWTIAEQLQETINWKWSLFSWPHLGYIYHLICSSCAPTRYFISWRVQVSVLNLELNWSYGLKELNPRNLIIIIIADFKNVNLSTLS